MIALQLHVVEFEVRSIGSSSLRLRFRTFAEQLHQVIDFRFFLLVILLVRTHSSRSTSLLLIKAEVSIIVECVASCLCAPFPSVFGLGSVRFRGRRCGGTFGCASELEPSWLLGTFGWLVGLLLVLIGFGLGLIALAGF